MLAADGWVECLKTGRTPSFAKVPDGAFKSKVQLLFGRFMRREKADKTGSLIGDAALKVDFDVFANRFKTLGDKQLGAEVKGIDKWAFMMTDDMLIVFADALKVVRIEGVVAQEVLKVSKGKVNKSATVDTTAMVRNLFAKAW